MGNEVIFLLVVLLRELINKKGANKCDLVDTSLGRPIFTKFKQMLLQTFGKDQNNSAYVHITWILNPENFQGKIKVHMAYEKDKMEICISLNS
jgi:hypothetical protein